MYYKNTSAIIKTFHGVQFKPGDIKEVNKYINDLYMIQVDKPKAPAVAKPTKVIKAEPHSHDKIEPKAESDTNSEDATK